MLHNYLIDLARFRATGQQSRIIYVDRQVYGREKAETFMCADPNEIYRLAQEYVLLLEGFGVQQIHTYQPNRRDVMCVPYPEGYAKYLILLFNIRYSIKRIKKQNKTNFT